MVNLPSVGGLIPTRDKPNESGLISELQELDGLMTGGAAVGVLGEEKWRKDAALRGTGADGLGVRDVLPQHHVLLPVRQEVSDPPAGGVRHVQTYSWESLSCNRAGMMVLKAELKSTNRILA